MRYHPIIETLSGDMTRNIMNQAAVQETRAILISRAEAAFQDLSNDKKDMFKELTIEEIEDAIII